MYRLDLLRQKRARRGPPARPHHDGIGTGDAGYTSKQVRPLLETQIKYQFLPQSVPAFAANEQFSDLRRNSWTTTTRRRRSSHQSTQPRHGLGNRCREPVPPGARPCRIVGERDTPTAAPVHGPALQIKDAGLPVLPQHRGRGAQDNDRTLRPGERFGWKLNEVSAHRSCPVP